MIRWMNNFARPFAYFAIFLLATISGAQECQDRLPGPGECGILKPDQLYNLQKLAEPDEFPWMARLRYNQSLDSDANECLAVLISRRYLIAPAHCFRWSQPDSVLFGKCEDRCKLITGIDRIIKHPGSEEKREKTFGDDIALVRLKEPLSYTYYMRPICLPPTNLSNEGFVAHHLISTGFLRFALDNTKRFLLVVGLHHCRGLYERQAEYFVESLMCASTCDNGSPYVSGSALMGVQATKTRAEYFYLIGILIRGRIECVDYTPEIFQRIDVYVDWIKRKIYENDRNGR